MTEETEESVESVEGTWKMSEVSCNNHPGAISSYLHHVDVNAYFTEQFHSMSSVCSPNDLAAKIRSVIEIYERCKDKLDKNLAQSAFLNALPELCFNAHLEDNDIVVSILHCAYELQELKGVFDLVHADSCLRLLEETKLRERKKEGLRTFCRVGYFLHHGRMAKLTFGGYRLADIPDQANIHMTPLNNSFLMGSRDLQLRVLLTLLQYGAKSDEQLKSATFFPFLELMVNIIIMEVEDLNLFGDFDLTANINSFSLTEYISRMRKMFRIILRTVYNPSVATEKIMTTMTSKKGHFFVRAGKQKASDDKLRRYCHVLFPGLQFGRRQPPSLQHMCRYVIRQRLDENWQLPDGIWNMDLPEILIDYLNLLED